MSKRIHALTLIGVAALVALAPLSGHKLQAADWATLKVKFVFAGDPPKLANHDGSKEPVCSVLEIPDESLIVGKEGGIANVTLILSSRIKEDEIHPDLQAPPKEPVVIDNNGCRFVPHIAFLRTGQPLVIKNSDQCGHNAKLDFLSNKSTNDMIPSGNEVKYVLEDAERANANPVSCSIHPWMVGYLIVRDHPYVGISDEQGVLTIENLPADKLSFRIAHEGKAISEGQLNGKKEEWRRGIDIELKPGMNDLGTITLDANNFK